MHLIGNLNFSGLILQLNILLLSDESFDTNDTNENEDKDALLETIW